MLPPDGAPNTEGFSPIDVMARSCDRLKQACALTAHVASDPAPNLVELLRLVASLRRDLTLQIAEEQEDLLPILQLRARPSDELSGVVRDVTAMHATARQQLERCATALERLHHGTVAPEDLPAVAQSVAAAAATLRRHLSVITAVVLPIARLRFTEPDLAALRQGQRARRGRDPLANADLDT